MATASPTTLRAPGRRRAAPPGPARRPARRHRARGGGRVVAQPCPRRPLDARHLVGHRLGGDAAGVRQRLPDRARARVPRRLRRRRGDRLAGPDLDPGRRRAGRKAHPAHRRGRAVDSGAAVREVREPGVHQGIPDDLGREAGLLPRARRGARIRDHAQPVGAGRPVPRCRRPAPAAAGGVHRQRGGPQDVRQRAAGRAAAADRRHGVRGRGSAAREGAALQLHGIPTRSRSTSRTPPPGSCGTPSSPR